MEMRTSKANRLDKRFPTRVGSKATSPRGFCLVFFVLPELIHTCAEHGTPPKRHPPLRIRKVYWEAVKKPILSFIVATRN